jgi:hypothetical protein
MAAFAVKLSPEDLEAIIDGVTKRLEHGLKGKQSLMPAAFKAPGAANYIGVSRARFYTLLKERPELNQAAFSNGTTRLWPRAFLDRWLQEQQGQVLCRGGRQGAQIKLPEKTTKQSEVHPGAPPVEAR